MRHGVPLLGTDVAMQSSIRSLTNLKFFLQRLEMMIIKFGLARISHISRKRDKDSVLDHDNDMTALTK